VVNARPDDEQMYTLHHKMEAERRLLADRNAAAAAKLKEKLEREKKEEAERIGRERWSKRRAEAMREKEKQREAAEAAAAAKYDAVSVTRERERNLQLERLQKQQMMEDAPVSPERYKVPPPPLWTSRLGDSAGDCERLEPSLRNLLPPETEQDRQAARQICREYPPLPLPPHRPFPPAQGREEEFVAFVFDKYDVPYELMPSYVQDVPPPVPALEPAIGISENGEVVLIPEPVIEIESPKESPKEDPAPPPSSRPNPPVSATDRSETETNSRPPRAREAPPQVHPSRPSSSPLLMPPAPRRKIDPSRLRRRN
jgi:hypothetical protein